MNDRLAKSFIGGFMIYWVMSVLLSLGITVGLIYVAWHFIAKFW